MQFLDVSPEGLLRQTEIGTAVLSHQHWKRTSKVMRGWTRNNWIIFTVLVNSVKEGLNDPSTSSLYTQSWAFTNCWKAKIKVKFINCTALCLDFQTPERRSGFVCTDTSEVLNTYFCFTVVMRLQNKLEIFNLGKNELGLLF